MESQKASRRHVDILAKWAAAPAERASLRGLSDPAGKGLCDWIAQLARPYYDPRYDAACGDVEDFIEECRLTLLRQARSEPQRLFDPDFSDERLERIIRWIAKCRRDDLRRRLQLGRQFTRIDESHEEDDEHRRSPPPVPWVEQDHWSFDLYPVREDEHRQARNIVSAYARSIRGQKKQRQVLAFFLRYAQQLGKEADCSRHWLVLHILALRRLHLSEDVRLALQQAFPNLQYTVINARIGQLRRSFHAFLAGNGLVTWTEGVTLRFFPARKALGLA
jgi:hypothetical protein